MKLSRKVLGVQYAVKVMAKAKPAEDSVRNEPWSVLQALADLPPEEMDLLIQDCSRNSANPKMEGSGSGTSRFRQWRRQRCELIWPPF